MDNYRISQTEQSLTDLSEIFDNIFDFTSSLQSARNTINKILSEIDRLEKSPN
jgi:archaellum component FlaC